MYQLSVSQDSAILLYQDVNMCNLLTSGSQDKEESEWVSEIYVKRLCGVINKRRVDW